jgi:hypothetical protein
MGGNRIRVEHGICWACREFGECIHPPPCSCLPSCCACSSSDLLDRAGRSLPPTARCCPGYPSALFCDTVTTSYSVPRVVERQRDLNRANALAPDAASRCTPPQRPAQRPAYPGPPPISLPPIAPSYRPRAAPPLAPVLTTWVLRCAPVQPNQPFPFLVRPPRPAPVQAKH